MIGLNSIVVGVDFTPCSGNALRQAIRLGEQSGARVRVVHVIDTVVVLDMSKIPSPQQQAMEATLKGDAEAAWTKFAADIPGASGLPFEAIVNNRTVGILNAARTHHADLLVLGAFGERKPDVGIGTVASACVRHSPVNVLLIRDTLPGPFKRVVCGIDFSDTSFRALDQAAALAANDGAELHVLHVFDAPWNHVTLMYPPDVFLPGREDFARDVQRRLDEVAAQVRAAHPKLAVTAVCYDRAGHRSGINEYAGNVGADLIALGTRGRGNLRDFLLGSTAEKSLAVSHCSVLAVKPAAS